MSLSGARQSDVTNVFHKKSKVLLDGVYHIVYEKHDIEQLDAPLSIHFVYNQNKDVSVENYSVFIKRDVNSFQASTQKNADAIR